MIVNIPLMIIPGNLVQPLYGNFPITATFSTTNACGWPRLVLTVQDNKKGNCVGYGAVLLPTRAGKYTRYVHMFAPIASSPLQEFLGWLLSAQLNLEIQNLQHVIMIVK